MQAVILASGFNIRLKEITGDSSKAFLPIKGRPIIDYTIDCIPEDIPITVTTNRRFFMKFNVWALQKRRVSLYVEEVNSLEESLGTIGSLEAFIKDKRIKESLLILGADYYMRTSLNNFIKAFDGEHVLVAVWEVPILEEARWHGVVKLNGRRIIEFLEKPQDPKSTLVDALCYIFPLRILDIVSNKDIMYRAPSGKMPRAGDFIAHLVDIGEIVLAYRFREEWYHLSTPQSYHNLVKGGEKWTLT